MKATSWKIVSCFAAIVMVVACAPTPSQSAPAAAPPSKCEIRFSAWCIAEGAYQISRVLASDGVHDRIWTLSGRFRPDSKLVVFEPNGCNAGYADKAVLLGVEKAFRWQDRQWDRISVRLKQDASCDLKILVPVAANDPMEWSYSSGLPLIRTCTKVECPAQNLGDLKSQIGPKR
jgi:hypothetical protein